MDLISAAESHCKARMDEHAYEMNVAVQHQVRENNFDQFMVSLRKYEQALSQFNVVQELKQQIKNTNLSPQKETTNEGQADVDGGGV